MPELQLRPTATDDDACRDGDSVESVAVEHVFLLPKWGVNGLGDFAFTVTAEITTSHSELLHTARWCVDLALGPPDDVLHAHLSKL